MNRLLTLILAAACFTATAQSDIDYPYNPDFENDGFVGIEDVLELLSVYGTPFTPEQLLLDGASLTEIIESLQSQIDSLASYTNEGFGAIALNDSLLTEYLVSVAAASEEGDSTLGAWVMQLSEMVGQQQMQIDSVLNYSEQESVFYYDMQSDIDSYWLEDPQMHPWAPTISIPSGHDKVVLTGHQSEFCSHGYICERIYLDISGGELYDEMTIIWEPIDLRLYGFNVNNGGGLQRGHLRLVKQTVGWIGPLSME